jgi:hypothetical protein
MTDKTVSVRVRFEGGDQIKAGLAEVGREGVRAMQSVESASARMGSGLQNAGFQISDFFVQVSAGTDPTRALAQQLPQLLGSFGLIGVAASVLVAALPSLWSVFDAGEDEVRELDESIKDLAGRIKELKEVNEFYSTEGIDKLIEKYGALNAKVLLLLERQRRQAEGEAMNGARSVRDGFSSEFEGLSDVLREYDAVVSMIESKNFGDVQAQKQQALLAVTEELNAEYGLTLERAQQIEAALAAMDSAGTVAEMADATATLSGLLEGSAMASTELAGNLLEAEEQLRMLNAEGSGIGGWLGSAVEWASGLADKLWSGAEAAAAIRTGGDGPGPRNDVQGGRSAGIGGPELDPYGFRDQLARDQTARVAAETSPRRGGGGGGGADPDQARAVALTASLRSETEQYALALEEVNRLKAKGLITDEVYARQIDKLNEKLAQTGDLGRQAASAIRGAFDNLFDDPQKALQDLSRQLAMMALYQGLAQGFPSIFGGGGVLPLGIPGFASGGMHRGGLRIVGENGPELEATGPAMIYPNEALRGLRGGAAKMTVNVANYAGAEVATSQRQGPDGEQILDVQISRSIKSGRQDMAMQGRFGGKPQRVVR